MALIAVPTVDVKHRNPVNRQNMLLRGCLSPQRVRTPCRWGRQPQTRDGLALLVSAARSPIPAMTGIERGVKHEQPRVGLNAYDTGYGTGEVLFL